MARIYRAEHEGLRRQVALKVLTDGVGSGTEGRARFLREARIAAAIKHPNVVNIFDIGVENHVPYLVMELLVGQDLEALLASHGALSESTIIDIIIPVVAGLVAVHDAGVVHRDLKPGNIFLSKGTKDEVEPKLLDFGISRAAGAEKLRLTSTRGLLMGTPLYMSPEALRGTDMTSLSDQYSLGVVLYECATGVNPFVADSVAETARRVTSGQFPPLSGQAIRPSRRLAGIIERAMSLDPSQRFLDMRALGQELLTLAGQRTRITWGLTFGEVAAAARARHAMAIEGPKAKPSSRSRRRGGVGAWPIAAAILVGVATVAVLMTRSPEREAAVVHPPTPADPALAAQAVAVPLQVVPEPPPGPNAAALGTAPAAADRPAPAVRDERPQLEPRAVESRTFSERDEERDEPEPTKARSRPSVPAPPVARPEPPVVLPETPEWIIERNISRRPPPRSWAIPTGTNDAPIFD